MTAKKSRSINRINKQKEIEQKRRKRMKRILVTFLILIVLIALGGYLFISPTIKIQTITVTGNKQLTREKVLELANIKTGDNIFLKSKGEQRGFLHTNVFSECCCIDVINTHLGLDKDERKEQLNICLIV